jgi:hypothetical protein
MAENAPGSVEALAKAFGYAPNQTADFRKRIEKGGLQLDPEKARAFARALSEVARSNGALDAVTKKTNAQMERFFTALTNAKDTIFQSGMDDGLGYMFGSLADIIRDLAPLAKAFGAAFKGAVSLITGAIKLVAAPLEIITQGVAKLFGMLGADRSSRWGEGIWSIIGAGGALTLLAMKFDIIKRILFGVNGALLAMIGHLARIALPLLAVEDVWVGLNGGDSYTRDIMQSVRNSDVAAKFRNYASFNNTVPLYADRIGDRNPFSLEVFFKDDADKVLAAKVNKANEGKTAAAQMETAQ